ncbi:MAG: hypothetical protein KGL63_03055 [Betaproteobacteria bacterium]|jgi:hypothetical protein|nr:hypothetical protein [Pseudomonadota bacterium]MDE2342364.1 hypothetical protein [Betaproteobacteria bacterium]
MNIPAVPTDSLYKFMALSGVLLVIVGVFYPAYLLQQLQPRVIDAQTTVAILKLQSDQLKFDVGLLKASKSPTLEQLAKIEKQNTEMRVKLARAEGEDAKVAFFSSQVKIIINLEYVVSMFGLFLALSGFSLWYNRVQKPADRLAERRVKELET